MCPTFMYFAGQIRQTGKKNHRRLKPTISHVCTCKGFTTGQAWIPLAGAFHHAVSSQKMVDEWAKMACLRREARVSRGRSFCCWSG